MADTGVRRLLYAVSAISLLSIIALPLLGGGWQVNIVQCFNPFC